MFWYSILGTTCRYCNVRVLIDIHYLFIYIFLKHIKIRVCETKDCSCFNQVYWIFSLTKDSLSDSSSQFCLLRNLYSLQNFFEFWSLLKIHCSNVAEIWSHHRHNMLNGGYLSLCCYTTSLFFFFYMKIHCIVLQS